MNNKTRSQTIIICCAIILLTFTGCSIFNEPSVSHTTIPNPITSEDFLFKVAQGEVEGAFTVHKFGRNPSVSTSIVPLTIDGNYRTPTTAIQLKATSSSGLDTNGSLGAWQIKLIGLNSTGDEISETLTMNGTSDTTLTNKTFLRLFRAYVTFGGTYGNQSFSTQKGVITISDSNDLQWTQITIANGAFGVGQSQIAVYSIPRGFTCYLLSKELNVESTRTAIVYFWQRQNITDITAPYSSIRLVEQEDGVSGHIDINPKNIITAFPELTDIGYMAETISGSASISADFELVCLQDSIFKTTT